MEHVVGEIEFISVAASQFSDAVDGCELVLADRSP